MADMSEGSKKLSRRTFLKRASTLAATAGSVSLLAACGAAPNSSTTTSPGNASADAPAATSASLAAGTTKVQLYSLAWQPAAIAAMQKSVETWNAQNGDRIVVEYVQGDWGKARDFLTTSIAGGVAPEIIQGITSWCNEYGQQGAYMDLSSLIDSSDLKADIHPTALDAATNPSDSHIYGLPWCWEVGTMFVNADRFAEQGIPIPEKGWTWDEFYTAAKKVTKAPDYYGLGANLGGSQSTEDVITWMWQAGAEVMTEQDGAWKIDLEAAKPALEFWKRMVDEQIVSPDSFAGTVNLFEGFPLGTFSIMQNGCWARRLISEAQPAFKWQMVPLPHNKREANGVQPQTWSIAAQAKERGTDAAAWEVVQWMANKENQAEIAYGDGLFPTRQSMMNSERFTTTENGWSVAQSLFEFGKPYPKHPAWSEFEERVLGPGIQQYLQGQLPLDRLIGNATEEGTKLIAKYKTT